MFSFKEYGLYPILLAVDGINWNTPTAPCELHASWRYPDSVRAILSAIAGSTPISIACLTIVAFTEFTSDA